MSANPAGESQRTSPDIDELVGALRELGERARFLAVNLAVVAAKLKKQGPATTRLNEDILDLVARITRASQDVNDALSAMESGKSKCDPASPGLWVSWQEIGVPDERTLEQLSRSLHETLELSRHVFRIIRDRLGASSPTVRRRSANEPTWSDEIGGEASG